MKIDHNHRKDKIGRRQRRHMRIRKRVIGTPERPRLLVRKTLKHLYVTVHDDSAPNGGTTLVALSTCARDGEAGKGHRNVENAKALGAQAAKAIREKGFTQVVFDRGGYKYHGIVKALADSVRENGVTI